MSDLDIGKIYILTNASLPNQYKVGRTMRKIKQRLNEYPMLGYKNKFVCILQVEHSFHCALEKYVHGEILEQKIRGEYFNFPDNETAISSVLSAINKFSIITEGLTDINEVKRVAAPRKKESDVAPTSMRIPDMLIKQVTKAAHRCEMPRTQYVVQALQAAVRHDLPSPEYRMAWDELQDIFDNLSPDLDENGLPDADMRLTAALETVLPRLRGAE